MSLGIRTTFNLVGPMVNPCRAQYRLLGVADEARMADVAGALARIGVPRAWVLRGGDGLDEITTAGATRVLEVRGEAQRSSYRFAARFRAHRTPHRSRAGRKRGRQRGDGARSALGRAQRSACVTSRATWWC